MNRIGHGLLALAACYLVIGVGLGIGMGIAHDFRLAPVHAHINLVGFVTHAVMGLAYVAWPALTTCRSARLQALVFGASVPIFLVGLVFAVLREQPLMAIIGSLCVFVGVLLFAANALRTLWAGRREQALSNAPAE